MKNTISKTGTRELSAWPDSDGRGLIVQERTRYKDERRWTTTDRIYLTFDELNTIHAEVEAEGKKRLQEKKP
jgi:hypothetical protein